MKLTPGQLKTVRAIKNARKAGFADLVRIAHLDPATDFVGGNFAGFDFGDTDLTGFNFAGADLRGANLHRAVIKGTLFDEAAIEGATWPGSAQQFTIPSVEAHRAFSRPSLRPHQAHAVDAVLEAHAARERLVLALLPYRSGKTAILNELVHRLQADEWSRRVLVVCPTAASRVQMADVLSRSGEHVEQAGMPSLPLSRSAGPVVVATMQALLTMIHRAGSSSTQSEGYHVVPFDHVILLSAVIPSGASVRNIVESVRAPITALITYPTTNLKAAETQAQRVAELVGRIGFRLVFRMEDPAPFDARDQVPQEELQPAARMSYRGAADRAALQAKRIQVVEHFAKRIDVELVAKSAAEFASPDGRTRIACAVSAYNPRKSTRPFWYAYRSGWDRFLQDGEQSFYLLACMDRKEAFALPLLAIRSILDQLHTSVTPSGVPYWHVHLVETGSGLAIKLPGAKNVFDLDRFRIS
jgi:hypothetical protein